MQLQLLSADGSTVFALAAHREMQLSFLQKYGFVPLAPFPLARACLCIAHTLRSYNVGIMALFFASKWFQYKQRRNSAAPNAQR
jgi:hypothetical protein